MIVACSRRKKKSGKSFGELLKLFPFLKKSGKRAAYFFSGSITTSITLP